MRTLSLCGVAGFAFGAVLSASGCSKSGGATNHPDSSAIQMDATLVWSPAPTAREAVLGLLRFG